MKIALLIMAPDDGGRALCLAQALAKAGNLASLFFYQRGVEQLNTNALPVSGQPLAGRWSEFLTEQGFTAIACVTSALSAGVLDATQAEKNSRAETLATGAELGGLGQLVDMLERHKVVTLK